MDLESSVSQDKVKVRDRIGMYTYTYFLKNAILF